MDAIVKQILVIGLNAFIERQRANTSTRRALGDKIATGQTITLDDINLEATTDSLIDEGNQLNPPT